MARRVEVPVIDRIARDAVVTETGCWLWQTSKNPRTGYATISVDGKSRLAHRASYAAHSGDIPEGMCVCHTCDVRNCVNPAHLFLGTHADNMADRNAKGHTVRGRKRAEDARSTTPRLTAPDVVRIREMLSRGDSYGSIAARFDVSRGSISSIDHGRSWKRLPHVPNTQVHEVEADSEVPS